ncbi:DNA polymerase III PolC-type [Rhynchospora pubera]|uniref:DNA polymerase III PolC-type n=1 Tax=Rhynchospora pubera TaxID=906938 RepID=A0AAV8DM52_9POAL|nr:DNA polymerase III PolC-type [Rhynchospora pubera]
MGNNSRSKNKCKGKNKKRKITVEQSVALSYIRDWVFASSGGSGGGSAAVFDDFLPSQALNFASSPAQVVFDLHSHSNHSDGYLSPSALVERAYKQGVKVLALTDHDTMSGVPEAVEAASKYGMRIIPGVEISALFSPSHATGSSEVVHILAYYSPCGPSRHDELDCLLSSIRDGRYHRAKNILAKLTKLKLPVKWECVAEIAGEGVAPGRLHIARAMVKAGHVEDIRQAFNKYLYDDGPAYAVGSEPSAEKVVELIRSTGGVSALAHPWSLKNPVGVISALSDAGLDAIEVYRTDGKVAGFSELADAHGLIKIGGSDFHGKGKKGEAELGSVALSVTTLYNFLKIGQPIWCNALKDMLLNFADNPSDSSLEGIIRFAKLKEQGCCNLLDACTSWLSDDEKKSMNLDEIRRKLSGHSFFR